jgi:hypothetical protein
LVDDYQLPTIYKQEFNEMHEEETIHVEEEATKQNEGPTFGEEMRVAGEDLVETVKKLWHEANVRRIVVKNAEKRILLEFPIVLGVAGIVLLPYMSALALIAALVTDCTIYVERVGEPPAAAEER